MRLGAVVAAACVAIAAGLALVLLDSEPRQAGSNYVDETGEVVTIEGNGTHCQTAEVVPADAANLRLLVGTFERPTPEIGVSVADGGETISTGELAEGGREGHVHIPIEPVEETQAAEVCIQVSGTADSRRMVLYGSNGRVRLEWLREGDESWLGLIPTVAHRFGLGKPFVSGAWVLGLAAVLLALAWTLALRLTLRELRR